MPAIFPVGSNALAQIRRLAASGDDYAEAIMALFNNTYYAALTPGAEAGGGAAANSIRVAGQIKDQDGNNVPGIKNVLIVSKPVSGAGTITDGGPGTVVAGSASINCWMTTDASGAFTFDVLNAAAEVNLVYIIVDGGTTEMLTLTFA
jgi:hypothetical protein